MGPRRPGTSESSSECTPIAQRTRRRQENNVASATIEVESTPNVLPSPEVLPPASGGSSGGPRTMDSQPSKSKPPFLLVSRQFTVALAAANREFAKTEPLAFICKFEGFGTRVRLTSMAAYYKYRQLLLRRNVPHREENKKPRIPTRKFVVKGVDPDVETSEIRDCLDGLGFKVLSVVNMTSGRTKRPLPMFLAVLAEGPTVCGVTELKRLCHYKVKIEQYRRMKPPPNGASRKKAIVQDDPAINKKAVPVESAPAAIPNSLGTAEESIALRPELPGGVTVTANTDALTGTEKKKKMTGPRKTQATQASQTEDLDSATSEPKTQRSAGTQTVPDPFETTATSVEPKTTQTAGTQTVPDKSAPQVERKRPHRKNRGVDAPRVCLCWDDCPAYEGKRDNQLPHLIFAALEKPISERRPNAFLHIVLKYEGPTLSGFDVLSIN
ncbi:hypothetical protein L9F63_010949 [Diploptera punctata]|uniref:Pre-C2HC domain-containing protein n=1 Tax=Diploptera punctata TaxID=6984 RepID=A0AAD8EPH9_DIPPU|nr:hypothetical protein L9F63_010949 [Diploptera punctata]